MPIWLRKFTFNKIKKYYEDEAAASNPQSANTVTAIDSTGKVNAPAFVQAGQSSKKISYK